MSRKKIDPMVQYAQEQEQQKMENIQQQFSAMRHRGIERFNYRRFSCKELIALFGGWFTLTYAFSTRNPDDTETDFYICSQDVSGIAVNKCPPVNDVIEREFGKKVYGFCIIAPSNAFA